jgi:hypothetical protein
LADLALTGAPLDVAEMELQHRRFLSCTEGAYLPNMLRDFPTNRMVPLSRCPLSAVGKRMRLLRDMLRQRVLAKKRDAANEERIFMEDMPLAQEPELTA